MTISMLAHSALGENAITLQRNIQQLQRDSLFNPTAKIMVLSGQAVLSDLRTVGAPLYSTPVKGNWLARIHKFAAKRDISVINNIYIRSTFEVSR